MEEIGRGYWDLGYGILEREGGRLEIGVGVEFGSWELGLRIKD